MTVLRPNVNAGRQRLKGALLRIGGAGLLDGLEYRRFGPDDLFEAVEIVLCALNGYAVNDGELIAMSDDEIADAKAKLSAALREGLLL